MNDTYLIAIYTRDEGKNLHTEYFAVKGLQQLLTEIKFHFEKNNLFAIYTIGQCIGDFS